MGRPLDVDDLSRRRAEAAEWLGRMLADARDVAQIVGLSDRTSVYTYAARYPDFPKPILVHGRCKLWYRPEITAWHDRRPTRSRHRQ